METKANTLDMDVVTLAKKLAIVTILGLVAVHSDASVRPTNLNAGQAQAIVSQVLERASTIDAHGGAPCSTESACLSKQISRALNRYGFATKTVVLNKTQHVNGIKMQGAPLLDDHSVTIVRLIGGWRVADPVVLRSARLEPFKIWRRRIESPVEMSVR